MLQDEIDRTTCHACGDPVEADTHRRLAGRGWEERYCAACWNKALRGLRRAPEAIPVMEPITTALRVANVPEWKERES
jgi:hypothetical protein